MKKFELAALSLLLSATVAHAQTTNPAPYCAAGYDDHVMNIPHYISNVTIGTLANNTGTTQAPGAHYIYYSNLTAPQLKKGSSYPLSVNYAAGGTVHFVAVFIDYNKNNSFADAGELVLNKKFPGNLNPVTANVVIPAAATTGTTRMRVMAFEDDMFTGAGATNAVPCTADATGMLDWGETEDYNVNITTGTSAVHEFPIITTSAFYPNPAKDFITLKDDFVGVALMVTDVQGKVSASYKSAPRTLDLHTLAAGIYFIKIALKDGVIMQQLIIEK